MKVDEKTVYNVANLAKIAVQETEVKNLQSDLAQILTWIAQLEEVNTTNVNIEGTVHIAETPQKQDQINDGNYCPAILSNAPAQHLNMFSVPKVVEQNDK